MHTWYLLLADGGHDSYEDAASCMQLMKWKVVEDLKKETRKTRWQETCVLITKKQAGSTAYHLSVSHPDRFDIRVASVHFHILCYGFMLSFHLPTHIICYRFEYKLNGSFCWGNQSRLVNLQQWRSDLCAGGQEDSIPKRLPWFAAPIKKSCNSDQYSLLEDGMHNSFKDICFQYGKHAELQIDMN